MGGLRAAGQLIAYELPMVLAVVGVVIQAGTLNLQGIVAAQANGEIFGFGGIGNPYILTQFVGFVIFLIAMQAELTQTPFDMPVAESELVAGYMTEYSGFRFLLFFIGEFAVGRRLRGHRRHAVPRRLVPARPRPRRQLHERASARSCCSPRSCSSPFLIFWVRFTYPRFREDQLQTFAWKFLIPLSLVNILATAVLKVVF